MTFADQVYDCHDCRSPADIILQGVSDGLMESPLNDRWRERQRYAGSQVKPAAQFVGLSELQQPVGRLRGVAVRNFQWASGLTPQSAWTVFALTGDSTDLRFVTNQSLKVSQERCASESNSACPGWPLLTSWQHLRACNENKRRLSQLAACQTLLHHLPTETSATQVLGSCPTKGSLMRPQGVSQVIAAFKRWDFRHSVG
jgi:hypothetical protein